MRANCDWECSEGHRFERVSRWDTDKVRCKCGQFAERLWLAPRSPHRQFSEPIVVEKFADGSFGFPGRSDAKPSKGAERIEIRSAAEYRRVMSDFNRAERRKFERRAEKDQEFREAAEHVANARLTELLRRTEDPMARDILRMGIEMRIGDPGASRFLETFNEVMEMDRSNRER